MLPPIRSKALLMAICTINNITAILTVDIPFCDVVFPNVLYASPAAHAATTLIIKTENDVISKLVNRATDLTTKGFTNVDNTIKKLKTAIEDPMFIPIIYMY